MGALSVQTMDSESSLERELSTRAGLQPRGRRCGVSQRALGDPGRGQPTHWDGRHGWGPGRELMVTSCFMQEGAEAKGGTVASKKTQGATGKAVRRIQALPATQQEGSQGTTFTDRR